MKRKKKLPIADFTTHDMRRTFATQLAEMNVPYDLIAAIVGHEAGRGQRTLVVYYVRTQRLEAKKMVLSAWNERLAEYAAQAAGLAPTVTLALPAPENVIEAKR